MTTPQRITNDRLNAFCNDTEAYLSGSPTGPLAGLAFAAKDILDVAGHVTGGGNPDWKATHPPSERTAWVVQTLVDAGATMVGKTHTDELTRGIFGENVHYGTPVNASAPDRVPGGSSSGSASAVSGGLVDFALGSDTGGSVRIPSSFCGLYGLRPTHNRIPLNGILIQAPSYDTIGWFARDIELFARIGDVLLQHSNRTEMRPQRLILAQDAFELADPATVEALQPHVAAVTALIGNVQNERISHTSLADWAQRQLVLQGREAWASVDEWIDEVNPRFAFNVAERYTMGRSFTDEDVEEAQEVRTQIRTRVGELLGDDAFICLPTAVGPAPLRGGTQQERAALQVRNSRLTTIAGNSGSPQINLPLAQVPLPDGSSAPIGLSLIGPRGSDEALISLAQELAQASS